MIGRIQYGGMLTAALRNGNGVDDSYLPLLTIWMQNFLLSCDWGTSSFRLRVVNLLDHLVIGERLSGDGTAATYTRWKVCCEEEEISKENFYLRQLRHEVDALSDKVSIPLRDIPVVISGMASSSIGIKELPYASLPFSLDGSDAIVQRWGAEKDASYNVWLLSGVRTLYDVMRGEETQIIGLASMDTGINTSKSATCIFPGTHSKHIKVQNGKIVDFQTYMTGEVFQVMSQHSILKDTLSASNNELPIDKPDAQAFCQGIRQSGASNLLHTLFTVRSNQLFEHVTKEENFFYLSGLLIGTELRSLKDNGGERIVLCSGSNVFHLYELAIQELNLLDRTVVIAPDIIDNVAMEGHLKLFQNHGG
jgi:2-dehydro-3-deoxygalactonokinase